MSEIWMIDLLRELLKLKEGTFIDIGVNIGQTLIKLKSVNLEIEYIGFEPNPACVFYVRELIKQNNLTGSLIYPVGIFKENQVLELVSFYQDETDSAASLIQDFRPNHRTYDKQYVPVFRFESLAAQLDLQAISIIKIDVEGAELEVLESLISTLWRFRPVLIIEMLPVYSEENTVRKERQERVESKLFDLEYGLFRVQKTEEDLYHGLQEVASAGIHADLRQCDYVALPYELKEKLFLTREP